MLVAARLTCLPVGKVAPPLVIGQGMAFNLDGLDADERYIFYLHGRIIEDQGIGAVSEQYGRYEYVEMIEVFKTNGFRVISEVRERDTDVNLYADKVVTEIQNLIDKDVNPKNITVVGASKGSVIAMLVSSKLQNPAINFVLIAGCNGWVRESLEINLCGRVLSIFEASDELAGSCVPIFNDSNCQPVVHEIRLNTGRGHGIVFKPLPEWMNPAMDWANVKR